MRILLVEDNRDILANLADYLQLKGYTVDCAQDGLSGFHLAVSQSFDLLAARQDPFACSYHAAISGVFQDASDERCQRFAGP